MSVPSRDRSLRRLVAELATASSDDVEAVLDRLGPRHRETVQSLVAEMVGIDAPTARPSDDAAALASAHRLGLSPWLVARLNGEGSAQGAPNVAVTPAARAALRAIVSELEPAHAAAPAALRSNAWWRGLWVSAKPMGSL
jgi:hypothetical protein